MLQQGATWSLCFPPAGTASTPGQHRGLFTFSICSTSSSSSDEITSFDVLSSGFSYLPCSPLCSLATIHWFLGCASSCLSVRRAFAPIAHSSPSSSFPLHSDPSSSLHQSGFPLDSKRVSSPYRALWKHTRDTGSMWLSVFYFMSGSIPLNVGFEGRHFPDSSYHL